MSIQKATNNATPGETVAQFGHMGPLAKMMLVEPQARTRRTVKNVRRAGLIIEREEEELVPVGAAKLIEARPGPVASQKITEQQSTQV